MRHTLPSMALIPTYSTITPILYLVLRKSQGRQLRKNYNNITCSLKQWAHVCCQPVTEEGLHIDIRRNILVSVWSSLILMDLTKMVVRILCEPGHLYCIIYDPTPESHGFGKFWLEMTTTGLRKPYFRKWGSKWDNQYCKSSKEHLHFAHHWLPLHSIHGSQLQSNTTLLNTMHDETTLV